MSTITTGDLKLIRPDIDDNVAQSITDLSTNFQKIDAGVTDNKTDLATHLDETVSHSSFFQRDASIQGNQKITLPFKAKSVIFFATVSGEKGKTCWGWVDENLDNRTLLDATNTSSGENTYGLRSSDCISITNPGGGNRTHGRVISTEDDGFTMEWYFNGTGATGTINVMYIAQTHGGGV